MMTYSSEEAADALRELGNIAFTHAATALATLVNRRVDVSIPSVRLLDMRKIKAEVASHTESLYVVSFRLAGDHTGIVAVLFGKADAAALIEILLGERMPDGALTAQGESTLQEIGNIMAGSALLAMYRLLGTTLIHSTPAFYSRTGLELASEQLFTSPAVLVVEAEFSVEARRARGTMIISPAEPAPLLTRLGIDAEAWP